MGQLPWLPPASGQRAHRVPIWTAGCGSNSESHEHGLEPVLLRCCETAKQFDGHGSAHPDLGKLGRPDTGRWHLCEKWKLEGIMFLME